MTSQITPEIRIVSIIAFVESSLSGTPSQFHKLSHFLMTVLNTIVHILPNGCLRLCLYEYYLHSVVPQTRCSHFGPTARRVTRNGSSSKGLCATSSFLSRLISSRVLVAPLAKCTEQAANCRVKCKLLDSICANPKVQCGSN